MNTRQATLDKHLLRASALIVGGLIIGAFVGLLTGVAGQSLLLIGLWPLAAGVGLGFCLTALSHLLCIQNRHLHLGLATFSVLMWCGVDRGADGALLWLNQRAAIAQSGLVLADHAVVHGSDDPSALTDAALLADTGASGVRGAMRVALRSGVPVLRAGHVQR
ncbi:MAG TPA: hypothetical protein DCQ06_00070, partial [Myxococcales bacterium]|nr:hypothetical protein [Myxococcales bacterium]